MLRTSMRLQLPTRLRPRSLKASPGLVTSCGWPAPCRALRGRRFNPPGPQPPGAPCAFTYSKWSEWLAARAAHTHSLPHSRQKRRVRFAPHTIPKAASDESAAVRHCGLWRGYRLPLSLGRAWSAHPPRAAATRHAGTYTSCHKETLASVTRLPRRRGRTSRAAVMLKRLQVENQLDLGRLLHRQIFFAFQD